MEIGRKIYYELNTGNVILITESRSGSVFEPTIDQDFQNYLALQPYQQSSVGVIQLDFGSQDEVNLNKYPCHIDISKNPIDETAIVWNIANPLGASLPVAQNIKVAQVNDLYNQKLAAGFTSSASGSAKTYIYNDEAQKDFSDLFLLKANGALTYPVTVYSATGESLSLSETQLNQLMVDIATFKLGLSNKKHDYLVQVQTATTVDQVNAIAVTF